MSDAEVIPLPKRIDPNVQDPKGTVKCVSCGRVFRGENFTERWQGYLEHPCP